MNDKELADAVVALGVGNQTKSERKFGFYCLLGSIGPFDAKTFVRDWRVAGALMEKAVNNGDQVLCAFEKDFWCDLPNVSSERLYDMIHSESLPRAIIEACVEALT